jgi:hypothetical protein
VILALVIGGLVVWSLPSLRRDDLEGSWTRTAAPTASEHFDAIVERYQTPERDANFALPAAVLRDTLNRDLSRALRHGDPLGSIQESQLVQAVHGLCGAEAGEVMARIYSLLRSLPPRHQAASLGRAGYLSQRDFERLRADVAKLQLALGQAQGHS